MTIINHQIPVQESGILCTGFNEYLIVGGYDKLTSKDTCNCFKFSPPELIPFPSLPFPTRRNRLIAFEDYIYCIGGVRETIENEISLQYNNNFFRFKDEK